MELVITEYGRVMEQYNHQVECDSVLPLEKAVMKRGLMMAIASTKDAADQRALINGYVMLGTFLQLTAAEREIVRTYNKFSASDFESTEDLNGRSTIAAFFAIFPAYQALQARAVTEVESLTKELKNAGFL